ncbi:beta-1,3-galactosyltransferase 1-like [Anthonomus grandis grandis]|uniref:beta-1,3-galactosyltransferase 1-like n=1 Tax=Anthonomus grandis grandis TaxID=2921223 RepID=UPI002166BBC9|nr:beta-1,3-galactosyltransferase 1-like [Anthonomus grandis grandis]
MRSRAISKVFFAILGTAAFFTFFLFSLFNVQEAEVPGWEYNISRNLDNYIRKDEMTATILPNDFCDKPSFLVIMCISSPAGFEARKVIRRTWGRDKSVMGYNVSIYFLLGQTTDINIQNNITEESLQYKDIIQEDFTDTYNNLTLKSAMMLKLFTLKCQKTTLYLLKIDDDIYLNLPKLIDDLLTRNQTKSLLMGSVICGSRPIRSAGDKWYAGPSYLFPNDTYPNYVSGTSYCMSGDVAEKLLNTALTVPVFHLEDVYLTGICAKKIGQKLTHNGRFTFHRLKLNYCLYKPLITVHYQEPDGIQKIHDAARDPVVEKHCQQEKQVLLVHRWLLENVFMMNKTKRRRRCP